MGLAASKREPRSKHNAEEDLIVLLEVAAAKGHTAWYGKTLELFQGAADKVNADANFTIEDTAKGLSDRYTKLDKDFDKHKRRLCCPPESVEEIGKAVELLAFMREARYDPALHVKMERDILRAREAKIRKGEELMMIAIERGSRRDTKTAS